MKIVILTIFTLATCELFSQGNHPESIFPEQQLENLTEHNDDNETENDEYLQYMQQYLGHPLNLNEAGETELAGLKILNILQVERLLSYRKLLGPLLDIYELQAIPLWTPELIRKIRPYVTVSTASPLDISLMKRLRHGQHSILLRVSQVPERSKGYLLDPVTTTNVYPGSPQKILLRYKYSYKQLLQFGILGEKDAGEQFFKGKQKQGFDFYSFHLFARHIGIIRTIAIGDFTVNMGQGLIQWQSMAFRKSADVMNIKRQDEVLKPYNSPGEYNFHRGVGITLAKNKWECSVFISYKRTDANMVTDSVFNNEYISSLQTSGYHRTNSESIDKSVQRQVTVGTRFSYRLKRLHLAANAIQYKFKFPLQNATEAYNSYALSGKSFGNYSMDYSYTWKNLHVFGEFAFNNKLDKAFIGGALISLSPSVDMSILYRNISKAYQSLYANAFTENTSPENEKGLYMGISVRAGSFWRIDAYADLYSFPWLKYRVDMPSRGHDFLIQATYKPNKQLEIYSRYHVETKSLNSEQPGFMLASVIEQPRKNLRTQLNYLFTAAVILRCRVEIVWFDNKEVEEEQGFLQYIDLLYKPPLKRVSGNLRLQYFETKGYNSRLYAFENDVLYSFSIPIFYDKGWRYYININYDVNKRLIGWIRWSQTLYKTKTLIGTGLDEIKGNKKSELKLQLLYIF